MNPNRGVVGVCALLHILSALCNAATAKQTSLGGNTCTYIFMAVPCRNRILFHRIFRSLHCIESAELLLRAGLEYAV